VNRIDRKFRQLKKDGKKAFIVYITAGDPDIRTTERLALELAERGVDILELGVPFSDPIADGPTIQQASQRALAKGINMAGILRLVRRIRRDSEVPIALMTYYNPVYRYGVKDFVKDAGASGVDGVIVPDLPPDEADELMAHSRREGFRNIFLLSPTSSPSRIKLVARSSNGFVYYVSLTGVTGARAKLPKEIVNNVRAIKRATKKPVCVGFGVSSPRQAASVARVSDGVIVGSAVIKLIEKNLGSRDMVSNVGRFARSLRKAVKKI